MVEELCKEGGTSNGKKTAGVKSKTYKQMKNKTGPFKKKKTAAKKKTYRRKK